jgi:M6 family metalloprotease-like protein
MIGKAYYIQAPQPLSWYITYHPGSEIQYATKDVLQLLDQQVDFSDFDRWTYNAPFDHTLGSDGKLDMVFVCYRRWYHRVPGSSFIALGWYPLAIPTDVYVDKNRRRIVASQGVNVLEGRQYPRLDVFLHEFGHVWGLPHNYGGGVWTLMGNRPVTYLMNSYEREQLGWLNFNDVSVDGTTTSIADFAGQAVVYRIAIPNTSPQEYFLFENHQQITLYDTVDNSSSTGPGMYILQDNGVRHVEANNLRVAAADGKWNWSNPYWIQNVFNPGNPLDSIPVFKRGTINRASGETDKVPHITTKVDQYGNPIYYLTFAWLDEVDGTLKTGTRFLGDGKDRFTYANNNMFSPWSGYGAYNWTGSAATTIGMEITGTSGTNINVKFYTTSPVNGPPSKPVGPRLSSNSGQYGNIRFSWAANVEPDFSSYEVWRKVDLLGNVWGVVATTTDTFWVDPEYIYAPGGGDFRPTYKVRAKDTQNLWSSFSDSTSVRAEHYGKRFAGNLVLSEFSLRQNYPNPFNATTTFTYGFPEDAFVSLKVFDVLGREIATLVNQHQQAGGHNIQFDASNLPSGIYLYKLRAGTFSAVKRMLLLK